MTALLASMVLHGFWMLLACIALVLLALGLMRALFPDFSSDDASDTSRRDSPERFSITDAAEPAPRRVK